MKKTLMFLGIVVAMGCGVAQAQTVGSTSPTKPVEYELPAQKLTPKIMYYQLVSDMAVQRRMLPAAYEGYMRLATETKDPRYAERAYAVAAIAGNREAALTAAKLLKTLAPNAVLGQELLLGDQLQNIETEYAKGNYSVVYERLQAILKNSPNEAMPLLIYADVAERLGKQDEAYKTLKHLVKVSPEDPEALNALGYFMADHKVGSLSDAETLIKKAHELNPKAAHIIDSMAWLAYRQGRMDEALKWSTQAAKAGDQEDVQIHYAEILWVTGRQSEALKVLGEVQKKYPQSTALKETVQRLNIPFN